MTSYRVIDRLTKVKSAGKGRWIARCPAHDDRSPSLAITELEDGRVLIHCFGGCASAEVLDALGLQFSDLYPERLGDHLPKERRPFLSGQVLEAVAFEALVAAVAASNLASGTALTDIDRDRLAEAASRLQKAVEVVHG